MSESLLTVDALVKLALSVIALALIVAGWVRFLHPKWRERSAMQRDHDVVIRGRAEIPANPITSAPAQPAIQPLGARLDYITTMLERQAGQVDKIHHELHPNSGESLRDAVDRMERRLEAGDGRFTDIDGELAEIREQIGGELSTATVALAHAAEASSAALSTIETAIRAEPPARD